ncbi:MAG: DNA alkylation repair protein [Betaproteobacteria bacterium]
MAKEAAAKVKKAASRAKRPIARKPPAARRPAPKRRGATPAKKTSATGALATLLSLGNAGAAQFAMRFFKTGNGQYGEGDKFLGIRMPALRALARDFRDAGVEVALPLLKSGWHEARALGLILMVRLYRRGDEKTRKRIYALYLKSTKLINNWDLVDLSAEHIVGPWLQGKPVEQRRVLERLATSTSLWERRIAILATFHYIKNGDYAQTFRIAKLLLKDEEDLIQKAVGWMLREVGKRISEEKEETFLKKYYRQMPRTMLRYAIERFAEPKRKRYLTGLV